VPPSRRRPTPNQAQTPPVRRRRVAGHQNRPTPPPDTPADSAPEPQAETPAEPPEPTDRESVSGTLDVQDTPRVPPSRPASPTLPSREPHAPDPDSSTEPTEAELDEPEAPEDSEPTQRPAGKRRAAGTARPADLTAAEAEAGARRPVAARPMSTVNRYAVAGVLALVAVVVAVLGFWFRGEAQAVRSGDDTNTALTDSATTSEVIGQLTSAIEDTFSYNYTDLASTKNAVEAVLADQARCEYDQLFGQIKELAPKQKIIIATAVRDIGVVRLDGDRAEALVFIDQVSTRVDTNKSGGGDAMIGVSAHRDGDTWKITDFNMFDQKMVDGQKVREC
jgi:Mce-associated membrane protein